MRNPYSFYCWGSHWCAAVVGAAALFATGWLVVDIRQRNWTSYTIPRHGDGRCDCVANEE